MNVWTTRLSADQTSNFSAGNHVEFDVDGPDNTLATVSTGVGQANGLVTINRTGTYVVRFHILARVNPGQFTAELQAHPSGTGLNDRTGDLLVLYSDDDFGTDFTPAASQAGVYDLSENDVIKLAFTSVTNPIEIRARGCALSLWQLA